MPTNSAYQVVLGENRIVSVLNNEGEPPDAVSLANILDVIRTQIPTYPSFKPDKGNRKVIIYFWMNLLGGAAVPEDDQLVVRVKVPAGVIRGNVQRFKFDGSIDPLNPDPVKVAQVTNPFYYLPVTRVVPLDPDAITEQTYAYPLFTPDPAKPWLWSDEQDQSIVIQVDRSNTTENQSQFLLEIDWTHTIDN